MIEQRTVQSSSTLFRQLALTTLEAVRRVLPNWSHRFSPKKFTQPQLAACLVLRHLLDLDYRGMSELLDKCRVVRDALALQRTPHYSTLARFEHRVLNDDVLENLIQETVGNFGGQTKIQDLLRKVDQCFEQRIMRNLPGICQTPTALGQSLQPLAVVAEYQVPEGGGR